MPVLRRLDRKLRAGVVFLSLLFAIACGDSSVDEHRERELTAEERTALEEGLRELESRVGFRVMAPSYVPGELSAVPTMQAETDLDLNAAYLFFERITEPEEYAGQPQLLRIIIIETRDMPGGGGTFCTERYQPGRDQVSIGRRVVWEGQVELTERELVHEVRFCDAGLYVIVEASWNVDGSPSGVTSEMREEVEFIVDSMS